MGTQYDNAHEVNRDPQADGPYLDDIREAERSARREARMAAAEKDSEVVKYSDEAQEELDFDFDGVKEPGEEELDFDSGDSDDKPNSVSL